MLVDKKKVNGLVVGLKLDFNLGYTFLKVVDFNFLSNQDLSKGFHLALYSYNYVVKDLKLFIMNDFLNSKELTGPLLTDDIYQAIRSGNYALIGNTELRSYEKKIPAMKSFSTKPFTSKYEKDAVLWRYFEGGAPYKWKQADYESVKHLEKNVALTYDQISTRISMELLKRSGEKIDKHYDLNNSDNSFIYYSMIYTERFDLVPNTLKGIAKI